MALLLGILTPLGLPDNLQIQNWMGTRSRFIPPYNLRIIPPMSKKKIVILGLVGSVVDAGSGPSRWQRWRPTVSLCRHVNDLPVARFELLYQKKFEKLTQQVTEDLQHCSPQTEIRHHIVEMTNPWDFEEVYSALLDFARDYPFNTEREEYLVHITTGTHVAQICLFLLTEAHYFPPPS